MAKVEHSRRIMKRDAIEAESGFSLLHGEAIAIGMTLESELAERLSVAEPGTALVVRQALDSLGLPTQRPRASICVL